MAGEQCAVLGDTWCIARLHRVIEPEKALPSTKFLMHINTTIRRLKQHHCDNTSFDDEQEEDMIDLLLEEENWSCDEKDVVIELECNEYDVNVGEMSQALSHLQVPLQAQESLVDTILYQSFESARKCGSYADGKIFHMKIDIDLYVV